MFRRWHFHFGMAVFIYSVAFSQTPQEVEAMIREILQINGRTIAHDTSTNGRSESVDFLQQPKQVMMVSAHGPEGLTERGWAVKPVGQNDYVVRWTEHVQADPPLKFTKIFYMTKTWLPADPTNGFEAKEVYRITGFKSEYKDGWHTHSVEFNGEKLKSPAFKTTLRAILEELHPKGELYNIRGGTTGPKPTLITEPKVPVAEVKGSVSNSQPQPGQRCKGKGIEALSVLVK